MLAYRTAVDVVSGLALLVVKFQVRKGRLAHQALPLAEVALQGPVCHKLNQYQGGMCISGVLPTTERTPRYLVAPLGPNRVSTDSAVW